MHFEVIIFVVLTITVFIYGKNKISKLVSHIGHERNIAPARIHYVNTVIGLILTIVTIVTIGTIIGAGYDNIGLFFGSMFAAIGVALFAQWSMLSNITASIIVFFFFPYRVGDHVKILDGDNSVEGEIVEIALFHVILLHNETLITFPNSMVFQRAVVITADRHKSIYGHQVTTPSPQPAHKPEHMVEPAVNAEIKP